MPTNLLTMYPPKSSSNAPTKSWPSNPKSHGRTISKLLGKTLRCLIDRKEGNYYIGRSEFDSPDVDNEIRIDAKARYLRLGDFVDVTIEQAEDFDFYASPTEPIAFKR